MPWCCIQRRNVALLWALDVERADVVISIDDDNVIPPGSTEDFIGAKQSPRFSLWRRKADLNSRHVCASASSCRRGAPRSRLSARLGHSNRRARC